MMTDNKIQTQQNSRLEQASPEPVEQQTQQSLGNAKPQSERRTVPGRMPLFRR